MKFEQLQYPIGKFNKPDAISAAQMSEWISEIESFPARIGELTSSLSPSELSWQYRPGGWTIRQVVHHLADSHMNGFIRIKLSLTERTPTIKTYYQDRWAELPDVVETPVSESLLIIGGIHSRWAKLLRSLSATDLKKEFFHPEHNKRFSIDEHTGLYVWHVNHHSAHIKQALEFKGDFSKIDIAP